MPAPAATPQATYKEQMQALLREAGPRLFARYYEALVAENVKVDDLRKGVELIINATDAALEKKTDQNSNLAVFNITFDMNGMQAVEQPKQELEHVEVVDVEPVQTAAAPKLSHLEAAEVEEMFAMLDGILGEPEEA